MSYLRIITMILIVISMFGCYTQKKANKSLNKAYLNYPQAVADFTRQKYPCIPVNNTDTVIKYDTLYDFIELIDTIKVNIPGQDKYISKIVTKTIPKIKQVIKYITVTKVVKDSAELSYRDIQITKLSAKNEDQVKKIEKKSNWINWLLIILAISLILNIILIRK
ncbi:hypothetical protein UFOVP217_38 [uncultured Caudovirales phage]|uniref:Lipoprotein n=1 Tax=uncultured Caudovirales phage TaxID=2100421 RepID=A0A6J7WPF5_9CAUD|nr:hypothetical protein UFOVP217_38 [uncultured Caudovirales phage]